jgi:hypothetical protein
VSDDKVSTYGLSGYVNGHLCRCPSRWPLNVYGAFPVTWGPFRSRGIITVHELQGGPLGELVAVTFDPPNGPRYAARVVGHTRINHWPIVEVL